MKRELKMRLALAGFLQDTLQEMARHKKDVASSTEQRATADELVDFIDRAKHGEMLQTEDVTRLARFFKDELTLDNRSEEHTSELQSLMRISYAVFCLKK